MKDPFTNGPQKNVKTKKIEALAQGFSLKADLSKRRERKKKIKN